MPSVLVYQARLGHPTADHGLMAILMELCPYLVRYVVYLLYSFAGMYFCRSMIRRYTSAIDDPQIVNHRSLTTVLLIVLVCHASPLVNGDTSMQTSTHLPATLDAKNRLERALRDVRDPQQDDLVEPHDVSLVRKWLPNLGRVMLSKNPSVSVNPRGACRDLP